jgi:hypothetical protein
MGSLTDYERGFLAGLVVGEGHFGVTQGTPQFALGMSVRHAVLLQHVQDLLSGSRLYGPYHDDGRCFLRLMLRGVALRSCLDIFDSLRLDRWSLHRRALRGDGAVALVARTRPSKTVS